MISDNSDQSLQKTSRDNATLHVKEFRFPKVWLSKKKQTDLMRSNPNSRGLAKRCDSNWSCGTNSSSASRRSEISFGCDKQIEVNGSSFRTTIKNTYIGDDFEEFTVSENQQKLHGGFFKSSINKHTDRGTQTDYREWYLPIDKTHIIFLVLFVCIIPGLTYFIFRRGSLNLDHIYHDIPKSNDKHSYCNEHFEEKQDHEKYMSTEVDVTGDEKRSYDYLDRKHSDYYIKSCQNINDMVQQIQTKLMAVEKEVESFHQNDLNHKQIDDLVNGYLYGPAADYALELTGGSIVDTPDTTTYTPSSVTITLFGVPIWKHMTSNPRIIIKGTMQPGQCWAFHGSEGKVIIRLAYPIRISAVTLEHFPSHLLPTSNSILSMPREFTVTGINECTDCSNDEKYLNFGLFEYEKGGPSRQIFHVGQKLFSRMDPVQLVEFHFKSNYGNPDYTCIYRVRVHGEVGIDM